jgi:AcrR family transcriptional regulator
MAQTPLYRKLKPRPHGPSREAVERNQRSRLFGAMLDALTKHDYGSTSVAELGRLAGVSKRTFYEQFENKETCFLATLQHVGACAQARLRSPTDQAGDDALRAGIESAMKAGLRHPGAARVLFAEAHEVGLHAHSAVAAERVRLELALLTLLEAGSSQVRHSPLVTRGILCGLARVLLRDAASPGGEAAAVAGRLARWADAYRSPAGADLDRIRGRSLVGPGPLRSTSSIGEDRARLLRAGAQLAVEHGHMHFTLAEVASRVGIREWIVRDRYESVEECLLDAVDVAGLEAAVATADAMRGDEPLIGVCRGLQALTGHLAADPLFCIVARIPPGVGGVSFEQHLARLQKMFADLFTKELDVDGPTEIVIEALVGALWGVIRDHVAKGTLRALPDAAPDLAYLLLAPVIGARGAVDAISRSVDAAQQRL